MRARGVKAQNFYSFFRWSGQTEWTPERMGQKFILRLIIWDEVCTMPRLTLETALGWLEGQASRSSAVATSGSRPQSPEKCHTAGSASGVYQQTATMKRSRFTTEPNTPPLLKAPKNEFAYRLTRTNVRRYERHFLVVSGGNALWKPGGHAISP